MTKTEVFVCVLLTLISFLNITSATYVINNYSIDKYYSGGDVIRGTINMSFNKQSSETLFTSNLEGNITLLDFITSSGYTIGKDFNCSISNCAKTYSIEGGPISYLDLDSNSKKIVGFKITGKDVMLTDFKLNVKSDALPSCSKQVEIDVLGKNENLIQNYKYTNETCDNQIDYGCFNNGLASDKYKIAEITGDSYCNKITLESAPAYWIGANVINTTSVNGTLTMTLYSADWDILGSCNLPQILNSKQKAQCLVEYLNMKENEMFVCISEKNANSDSNYKIQTEDIGDVCGTSDINKDEFDGDYEIFASSAKYDTMNVDINYTNFAKYQEGDLIAYLNDYIDEKYSGDCSLNGGCLIPIDIKSYSSQRIDFSNFEVKYKSGATFSTSDLYLFKEKTSNIDSGFLTIDISKALFELPLTSYLVKFEMYIDGDKKITAPINVTKGFEFNLLESNFTAGLESNLVVESKENISGVKWEFGDGTMSVEGKERFIKHRYIQEGVYELKITVTRADGALVTKTFNVVVGDSKIAVSRLISEREQKIGNLTRQINSYDLWIKNYLNGLLNIDANGSLEVIKEKYNQASDSQDYSELISELLLLNLPDSIYESQKGTLPLAIGFNNLDASFISQYSVEGASAWDEKTISDAKLRVIDWNIKNFDSQVEYKNIDQKTSEGSDGLASYFKININKKSDSSFSGQALILINYPRENIVFKQDYGAIDINNGAVTATSIDIKDLENIEFIIPSKISPGELSVYIFPTNIGPELGINDIVTKPLPPKRPYWTYIILIISFFIIYIILQEWYKKRYEIFLFPNRDDLFNMVNFINNSKISGTSDEKIVSNLLNMKWKREQINYAMRKLEGKRTGMWEIPIFKIFENNKVRKEIERRQNNPNQEINFGA